MRTICFLSVVFVLALTKTAMPDEPRMPAERPNVVVILADDLGYGDVSCDNPTRGKIKTPRIDRLAAEGIRFTDAHSSSGVCSPSRYALLTGRYHWRTRLQNGIVNVWGGPLIARDRLTIGGLAQKHGYRTACVGKWHLGWNWPIEDHEMPRFKGLGGQAGGGGQFVESVAEAYQKTWRDVFSRPIADGPTTRGFDNYFGTDVPNWPPYCFIENDRTVGIPSVLLPAAKLVKNQASLQGPALADWQHEPILPTLTDRACQYIVECSNTGTPFLLYLPLTTPHTPLAVNAQWRGKSGLNNDCADLILETDAAVGRVLDALETSGVANNTLVLFTSDNGFAAYAGAKELESQGHFPSGPLRGYKADVWEGGHRVPFVVRWPKIVKPGSVSLQLVHHADLIATLADIFQDVLPDNAGEDSFSLMPLLLGHDKPIRETAISCASNGVPGLRQGHWKYIPEHYLGRRGNAESRFEPEQLYNLFEDLSESNNLAASEPKRVFQMKAILEQIITKGRSTPGKRQPNDVRVVRYPQTFTEQGKPE